MRGNFRSCSILVLLGIIALLGFISWAWISEDAPSTDCRLTQNGAWISVDWVSKPIEESAVRELAENASRRKIRHLFAYTTYLKPNGSFNPTFDNAPEFVSQFRRFNPNGLVFAWVGVPLKNDRAIGIQGWVDLTDPSTRQKIVTLIVELMARADFDGVHLNVETVRNNDPAFLQVLDEIRAAIGSKRKISIAASHWMPGALNALPFLRDFRWTDGYYRQVAKRVDQIVTMTYDSYSPTPAIYRLWVREQVRGINASLTDSGVELLIGISVSKEETLSHQPPIENLRNGLAGLCAGISNHPGVNGVAIYADWDFSESDDRIWNGWVR